MTTILENPQIEPTHTTAVRAMPARVKQVYLPSQRVILVAGRDKYMGREIAYRMGMTGARVLLGTHDSQHGESAVADMREEGIYANFVHIDGEKPDTLAEVVRSIEAIYGRLDVLVNCAGIADQADGPPSSVATQVVRRIFDRNFFAALSTTQIMLPLLLKSRAGRVVNVSSGLGALSSNHSEQCAFTGAKHLGHSASDAALNMLTVQLAHELKDLGIKVNAAGPDFTAIELGNFD
ncbi:MAG TPA: SDR family NAD(P)-dependent oxidoreductase [Burkholderiaceae bacterium]|jgi:NAD(P)-dependent dehydrogenase (short-subunit alcohol dehydrogenase family)